MKLEYERAYITDDGTLNIVLNLPGKFVMDGPGEFNKFMDLLTEEVKNIKGAIDDDL